MQKIVPVDKEVYELRKRISLLEWDIPNVQNSQLKVIKEEQLNNYKREFHKLLEKRVETHI